jgi:hypothetical protein
MFLYVYKQCKGNKKLSHVRREWVIYPFHAGFNIRKTIPISLGGSCFEIFTSDFLAFSRGSYAYTYAIRCSLGYPIFAALSFVLYTSSITRTNALHYVMYASKQYILFNIITIIRQSARSKGFAGSIR